MTTGSEKPAAGPSTEDNSTAVLQEFDDYADAQRLVDRLSDSDFPVEHVRIVGTGIHTVEQVTGRMTKGLATLYGALSGAWLGLLIAGIFWLFATGPFLVLPAGVVIGAFWGAVFGFIAHAVTRGRRDFSSIHSLEAERYAVLVGDRYLGEARRLSKADR